MHLSTRIDRRSVTTLDSCSHRRLGCNRPGCSLISASEIPMRQAISKVDGMCLRHMSASAIHLSPSAIRHFKGTHRTRSSARRNVCSMARPAAILCDVNGTLFSLDPIGQRMQAAGLQQSGDLQLWFAQVLRDGISSNAGKFVSFREIGSHHLQRMLRQRGLEAGRQQVEQILGGFDEAVAHDDVGPGLKQIGAAGIKVATMTNGSVAITEGMLQRSGLDEHVCLKLDVAGPQKWKPAPEAYHYAVERLQLQGTPEQVMLVAIHPWDCQGAKAAGLSAAYINRDGQPYPSFYLQPDLEASSMTDLAGHICLSS